MQKLAKERPDLLAWLTGLQTRFCAADAAPPRRPRRRAGGGGPDPDRAMRRNYDAAKARRQAALDYDDLIMRTLDLLVQRQAAPWVQYKLDGGLDHILIDEAQDTSPEQWQILRALTEEFFSREATLRRRPRAPRTLFAVGDEKQSIFSFQGADPAQFDINRAHFQAPGGGRRSAFHRSAAHHVAPFRAANSVLCRHPVRERSRAEPAFHPRAAT